MSNKHEVGLNELKDIKHMMEKSSRFISLSGLSGVAAGFCALVGAFFAHKIVVSTNGNSLKNLDQNSYKGQLDLNDYMGNELFVIATVTFISAFLFSFLFTWLRSKKLGIPLWGSTSKRVAFSVAMPMVVGGIYLLKLIENGVFGLIAPGCLIFYGLALVNASKYTLGEVKYLGYFQIVLGVVNLYYIGYGIYFWASGFGIVHIVYGLIMWNKYERVN